MKRNSKSEATLGEIPGEELSDRSSILLISTIECKESLGLPFVFYKEIENRKMLVEDLPVSLIRRAGLMLGVQELCSVPSDK